MIKILKIKAQKEGKLFMTRSMVKMNTMKIRKMKDLAST